MSRAASSNLLIGLHLLQIIGPMRTARLVTLFLAALVSGCTGGGAGKAGPASSESPTLSLPVCNDHSSFSIRSQGIALGTIVTTWRVTNRSANACTSFGYPRIDFHTDDGWLHARVVHGRLQSASVVPSRVVLKPGKSLYFVSEWGDADTASGPCKEFDRVKVTLPNNVTPARLHTFGCIGRETVSVGPVSATIPSSLRSADS
jgi:hypothetical protein